jgi:predicted MFS family arabinose efflux permease
MTIRLLMLAVAALFTPQAAGTAAMMVPPERRGSTMSYVFLGWSLALAIGLPLIAYVASHVGWRVAYGGIGVIALLNLAMLVSRIPGASSERRSSSRRGPISRAIPDRAVADHHGAADFGPVRRVHLSGRCSRSSVAMPNSRSSRSAFTA